MNIFSIDNTELKLKGYYLLLSMIFLGLDQLTKQWVSSLLELGEVIPLFTGANLTLAHNHGIAFSLLAENTAMQGAGLAVMAIILIIFLFIWFLKTKAQERTIILALSAIIGGAIGNVVDRFCYGYVIDFIDLYIAQWHWPVFNLADSLICIGAFFVAIETFRAGEK